MSAGPQERLQQAVSASMDQLDRKYIRALSKKAYQCMGSCYDQPSLDSNGIQQCIERCSGSLQDVNTQLQNELNYFQNRVQRCSASCEDDVRDAQARAGGNTTDAKKQAALQSQYNGCVSKCVDQSLPLIKQIEDKLGQECKKRL